MSSMEIQIGKVTKIELEGKFAPYFLLRNIFTHVFESCGSKWTIEGVD